VKLRITILKYHSWYLCQISLQIMLFPILILHNLITELTISSTRLGLPYALLGVECGLEREVRNTRERREKGQQNKTKQNKKTITDNKNKKRGRYSVLCSSPRKPAWCLCTIIFSLQFLLRPCEIYIFKGIAFKWTQLETCKNSH